MHLKSRRHLDPVSPVIECFPAVLQALTARPLQLPALSESFIADLAAAVSAVTDSGAWDDIVLTTFQVSHTPSPEWPAHVIVLLTAFERICTQLMATGP